MKAGAIPPASFAVVMPEKRRKLRRREFAQLMLDQNGLCWACGLRLKPDSIIDEHLVPLDQGGSNEIGNRALFCEACAREKTLHDLGRSAHGRRLRGESGQKRRRRMRRAGLLPPSFPTNRDGKWKKKLNGEVVLRGPKRRRRSKRRAF